MVELVLVRNAEEIRQALKAFNIQANSYQGLAVDLIRRTTYWVYDPQQKTFGPKKFVGFKGMDFEKYKTARTGMYGKRFDGNKTKCAIEKSLGRQFQPNDILSGQLIQWAKSIYTGTIDNVSMPKWRFVSLPVSSPTARETVERGEKAGVEELEKKGHAAKEASHKLAHLSTDIKNKALLTVASQLLSREKEILQANRQDCEEAKSSGMGAAMVDRLMLSPERLESIAADVRAVAALPDPVGEFFDMRTLPNGLQVGKKRVPLGVIGTIYESRPNVTVDISTLCLKSGNAVVLRGGKEAQFSNRALALVVQDACLDSGVPQGAVQFIESTDRALVGHMLRMKETIDLIIPRGGQGLIKMVAENSLIPVVAGGIGVCHTYVDKSANLGKAVAIAYNAKVQRPTVCNALDTLLVHADIARDFLPLIAREWGRAGVEMHCDQRALEVLRPLSSLKLVTAVSEDWGKEFLALIAAVRVVDSLDQALEHIQRYTSGHSEAIVAEDYSAVMRFLDEVDAACVYANASTRFTDGGQFGLGAEVGISTQKLHARGPMGLKEMTTYKWIILGTGQVRP